MKQHSETSSPTEIIRGFEFDYLPDFLSDHTLMADAPSDRISEHARRWGQFVGGLWCDDSQLRVYYQLRYQFHRHEERKDGRLRMRLLMSVNLCERRQDGRECPLYGEALTKRQQLAVEQLNAIRVQLMELGFSPTRIDYDLEREWEAFQTMNAALEVRQREMMLPIKASKSPPAQENDHYMVEPWLGMAGPFLLPVQILCAQAHDVWICINLKPSGLSTEQMRYMAGEATFGMTYAGITESIAVGGSGPQIQVSDPQAAWLGKVFSSQVRRLGHQPFACRALVLSCDETSCEAVASALASSVNTETLLNSAEDQERLARSRAEVVPFDSMQKAGEAAVLLRFSINEFAILGIQRCKTFQHMRYVTDAAGAATVFRFPVNIRGGVPGIAVRQIPPDFNPGPQLPEGKQSLLIGLRADGGEVRVPMQDFAKHALITGFTGTGKTNTVLHLLDQFWRSNNVPFLVIESAKAEYRGFIRVKDIPGQMQSFSGRRLDGTPVVRIYTVGNESCSPLRLNPFELLPGVRLESHISRLQACFEAAIPQGSSGGPVPSLLADALPMIYQEKGWSLLDEGYPRETSPLPYPTMADLRDMLLRLLEKSGPDNGHRGRGYSGEVLNNLKGFILGRVGALLQGSRGLMFGVQHSVPLDELFNGPAIIELNDLNEADKGLVVMFLLVMLREYREKHPIPGGLGHVTVVEEAHNVLSNPAPGTASEAQEKAVQAFCNMLAEIRSLGEGLIIADQSPQKLARDAIRNTNVQITHALRDSHDRNSIADCSLMTDEQRDYLGKIRTGWAAAFFMGLEKATFVKVPSYAKREENYTEGLSGRGEGFASVTDGEVRKHMQKLNAADRNGPLFDLCQPCKRKCEFRKAVLKGGSVHPGKVKELTENLRLAASAGNPTDLVKRHAHASAQLAVWSGLPGNSDTLWCAAVHVAPPGFFGLQRKVEDHHHTLCNSPNGFAWALAAYPARLQHEQRDSGNDA